MKWLVQMEIHPEMAMPLVRDAKVTTLFLITNEERTVRDMAKLAAEAGIPLVVATNSKPIIESIREENVRIKKLAETSSKDIHILTEAEDILVSASVEGLLGERGRVLCIIDMEIMTYIMFEVKDIGITALRHELEDRVDLPVLQAVMNLSVNIAREGREGHVVGCLFVLGDTEAVLANSRQLIINPFKGHPEEQRNILDEDNWETVKEFTQLDGAFIIDRKGLAVAVGRYISPNWDIYLQGGLGGRHLAAASISKTTKALAVTVSTSGTIRVFKDGKVMFKVSTL